MDRILRQDSLSLSAWREGHLKPFANRLELTLSLVRDRVRGVRTGVANGFFLHGPAGTGKTHAVLEACKEFEHPPTFYYRGHITPLGLLNVLAEHTDATIILDDVHSILEEQKALQIFLAALGTPETEDGTRVIRYMRGDATMVVRFRGSIIGISNLELRSGGEQRRELLGALASRIHVMAFAPSREELAARMFDVASQGWHDISGKVLAADMCLEIAEFVIEESIRLDLAIDLRVLVEKAYGDYWLWSAGETDNHWHDLVRSTLQERPAVARERQCAGEMATELELVATICRQHSMTCAQLEAWREATKSPDYPDGKPERTFYRRKARM